MIHEDSPKNLWRDFLKSPPKVLDVIGRMLDGLRSWSVFLNEEILLRMDKNPSHTTLRRIERC